jgi:hypothetical protein
MKKQNEISFEPSNSVAAVFSNSEGLGALYAQTRKQKTIRAKIEGKVADYFKLTKKVTGTRGGMLCTILELQKHFGGDNYLILGSEIRLNICRENFPMNKSAFFYTNYDYEGEEEAINKKLRYSADTLILSKSHIFEIDGKPINKEKVSNLQLNYYNNETQESIGICNFFPIFPDDEELKSEIKMLVEILKGNNSSKEDITKEIETYLNENYGKPQKDNMNEWLRKHIQF